MKADFAADRERERELYKKLQWVKIQKIVDGGCTQIDPYKHNTPSTPEIWGTSQKGGKKEFKG